MKVEYKKLIGKEFSPYLEVVAQLRIKIFKEYPYLYDGSLSYEMKYLNRYTKSVDFMCVLAMVDGVPVGATTCMPLAQEEDIFKEPFLRDGYDVEKIFYFGESILLSEYRGHGIGKRFIELREVFAKETISELTHTCFCAVQRVDDHPLAPNNYKDLKGFWNNNAYYPVTGLKTKLSWKDINEKQESEKVMQFWLKEF